MSFAFASVVAAQNGWAYGSLAYGVATYISVSRINDDWHYLHDVLIGMGIGASYGWGLKYAYDEGLPFQLAMLPMPGGGRFSFTYSY
jgi:membrane-associated phospholipid phosphatase